MTPAFEPIFPGLLLDAAARFAQDCAAAPPSTADPLRDMGWTCTLVPEEFGGAGASMADVAAIAEGLATHGVHLPLVETCAVAPLLLQAAAPDVASKWLAAVCDGSAQVAPLVPLSAPVSRIGLQARQLDIGFTLEGEVRGVDVSLPASHWIVAVTLQGSGEPALFLVEADRIGPPRAAYQTMEGRRGADFALHGLTVPAGACIARGASAHEALAKADDAALLVTAADTVAALASLIQLTIRHLQERRQFGVALATFQVLRHRVADMYVRYLGARGLVLHAFDAHAAGAADAARTLRLMKVSLAETARQCAELAIQMHGGMGVSEEVLATRLAQRLIASEFRYGDRLTLAAQLLARPAAPAPESQPLCRGASA